MKKPVAAVDPIVLSERAQRRAADPAASVWVTASAGTGKTKVLTDRILNLLLAGVASGRILALTFTKAAAAEMANRIAETLGKWSVAADGDLAGTLEAMLGRAPDRETMSRARALFAQVLDAPGGMHIQTIHAFCQSLLGRFPLEAGVAPHSQVMDERDAAEMLLLAREEVLSRVQGDGAGELARALGVVTLHVHETTFDDVMAALAAARGRVKRLLDRFGSVAAAVTALRKRLDLKPSDTPDSILAAAVEEGQFDRKGLKAGADAMASGKSTDAKAAVKIAAWLAAKDDAERMRQFGDYVLAFLTGDEDIRAKLLTKDVAAKHPAVLETIMAEAERLRRIALKRRDAVAAEATEGLLTVADALLSAYEKHKDARALLDYDDLILIAKRLLEAGGGASWVLFKLDGGIDHILVDEAQDTNPDQWRVIDALAAEFFAGRGRHEEIAPDARTIFVVGDMKQSIYSFQGADPAAFRRMRERFQALVENAGREWRPVGLVVSFRSVPAVLDAVDRVFTGDTASGVADEGENVKHVAKRAGEGGTVEIWPPLKPKAGDPSPPWKPPVERSDADSPEVRLAELLAQRLTGMIGTDMLQSKGRPVRAGDIMVLVRRRTGFVDALVKALKERGVAVAGVDRMVLTEQLAVIDLIALGRFLLLPEDDLTLACVLKGPLLGFDDERLFRIAHGRKGTLWRALIDAAKADAGFTVAHDYLAGLLAMADFTPPYELYAHVLGGLGGRKAILGRLGPDADDPISVFLDLALSFERGHAPSLQAFLHWLEAGAVEIKRDLEHGRRDAVRVLTVHGAKGLQAPIVFMPDTLQVPKGGPKLLWPEGPDGDEILLWPPKRDFEGTVAEAERARATRLQEEEHKRLLYVAMTRAEDRLYVAGWETRNKPPVGNWYERISAGLDGALTEGVGVKRMTSPQAVPVEPPTEAAERARAPLPAWAFAPPAPEPTPSRPLAPSRPEGEEPAVLSPLAPDDKDRFRRGILIHRLLQSLPDIAASKRRPAAARWLKHAAADWDEGMRESTIDEVEAVLDRPELRHLFGPDSVAEVPLTGVVAGAVVSAQIDRLAVTDDTVEIVDFKTNRPPPTSAADVAPIYVRQMALYRDLLRQVFPGKNVRCVLLWTVEARSMTLDDAVLDAFIRKPPTGSTA